MTSEGRAASVKQRLLNLAHSRGEDFNQILTRYAGLRFLARLAASVHADKFLLKGATLFLIWNGSMHRPTRDIDLLGVFEADEATLAEIIREVCDQIVDEDGVQFDPTSVRVETIREQAAYGGLRCHFVAKLGSAKLPIQLDVGFGDDVTPYPIKVEIPRLLEDEVRREMRAYPPATVIAEKFEAIVRLGLANSRMKDYLDLDHLLQQGAEDKAILTQAIKRTFKRRRTPLPSSLPIGLTEAFWNDDLAQRRWQAFSTANRLSNDSLQDVCERIARELRVALDLDGDPPKA